MSRFVIKKTETIVFMLKKKSNVDDWLERGNEQLSPMLVPCFSPSSRCGLSRSIMSHDFLLCSCPVLRPLESFVT